MFEILQTRAREQRQIAYQVSQEQLRQWVEQLSRPRHYRAQREQNKQVCRELAQFFSSLGYAVSLQGSMQNVVALPAQNTNKPLTLIGAHYDSVPDTPGADDNASALAAMMGVAQALATKNLPVMFVAFNGEEDGMLGSDQFVKEMLQKNTPRLGGVHILEMLGYTDKRPGSQKNPLPIGLPDTADFLALIGDKGSDVKRAFSLASTVTPGLSVMALSIRLWLARRFDDLHRSDHAPFWEQGLSATLWTDTGNFRNPHYHMATDTPDTLDYDFLQQITELLIHTVRA
jgi:Zn-dependent M28 family amino/carboxypeptidase